MMVYLDVVIGTLYFYLFVSLLASGVHEWLAGWWNSRGRLLKEEIPVLVGSEPGKGSLGAAILGHALVRGFREQAEAPSHIPPPVFAMALMDLAMESQVDGDGDPAIVSRQIITRTAVELTKGEREVVEGLIRKDRNPGWIADRIAAWFEDAGQKMSQRYKRESYPRLFAISLLISLGMGMDTFRLVEALYRDPVKRTVIVEQAKLALPNQSEPPEIPIGWGGLDSAKEGKACMIRLAGCVLTAFAGTMSAPFWYDILSLLLGLRRQPQTAVKQGLFGQ